MATIEKSIDVQVPVRIAYDQWTQFEDFPHFMEGVEQVKQLDDKHLHWKAKIAGKEEEWDAVISEQIPDKRIAWHSTSGNKNGGVVTFHRINDAETKVMLQMEYEPEGVVEKTGDKLGVVGKQVEKDLERFKSFIESRQKPTGGWRGEIDHGKIK